MAFKYQSVIKGFLLGFTVASLLWGGGVLLYRTGTLSSWLDGGVALAPESSTNDGNVDGGLSRDDTKRRRRRRRRQGRHRSSEPPRGNAVTGDDLNGDGPREVDLSQAGGEQQLSSAQIDGAFDQRMAGIRRCLLLVPAEHSAAGRVVFGLRITPEGTTEAVQLSGPAVLTTGAVGDCLHRTARAIVFPAFEGPPMVARYPITFE
jgi:hypothetical protein